MNNNSRLAPFRRAFGLYVAKPGVRFHANVATGCIMMRENLSRCDTYLG